MNRLKELRIKNNLTLDDIEANIDIKRGTYSNYENNKTEPKIETWKKLAEFYGVSPDYLMGLNSNDFGSRIKELRKDKGISQAELAEKAGVSRQAISFYEKEKRHPKIETWQKIACALNTNVSYARGEIDTELIAKIAKMAFCLLEPSLDVELGEKALPEKGKKGCIGLLLIALINQLGLNTEDIIKEISLKMEGSDFASMINNDDVEGLTEAGLKLANTYDEI